MISSNEAISHIDVIMAYDGPDETGEDDMNWDIANQSMNALRLFAKEYAAINGRDIFKMTLPQIKEMLQQEELT